VPAYSTVTVPLDAELRDGFTPSVSIVFVTKTCDARRALRPSAEHVGTIAEFGILFSSLLPG